MATVYVVGTPIGNLEDITLRALKVLQEVHLIAAEDTRVTRKLLSRYEIATPVTSYHDHNKEKKLPTLTSALTKGDLALVCDAGTPGVNDPGAELVETARRHGHSVVVIPGASAVTAALAVSGIAISEFLYMGFLSRRRSVRREVLKTICNDRRAIVLFESPHRLLATLKDILDTFGDTTISVCRELTKVHEEVFHGTVSDALVYFTAPRGEFTLVISATQMPPTDDLDARPKALTMLRAQRDKGMKSKEAIATTVAETSLSRNEVYEMWVGIKSNS